ncbi:MAG: peptide chain release factor 2 [Spirochaetaceae bacterium]
MLTDYEQPLRELEEEIYDTWRRLDPDILERDIQELEAGTADPEFWNDREKAEEVIRKINRKRSKLDPWKDVKNRFDEIKELWEISKDEGDNTMEKEIKNTIVSLQKELHRLQTLEMFSGKYDDHDLFLTIHSGAGGTEACDWVSMLYRMYARWCEKNSYKMELIDILEAEGGIKSVTLEIKGVYAYGYLHGETGIHRLVRISPFDSNKRRHTSFASVYASPVIDDEIEVDIRPEDLKIDTYRAQGAGGQHVNKTDSAVRITHLKTGIVVQCQNERSQHKNKATAMKVLKSRLYEHYKEQQNEEHEKHAQDKKDIAWGHQIRSYVFHPYNMVKDHRTGMQSGNVQAVMDGDIDDFIHGYLKWRMTGESEESGEW